MGIRGPRDFWAGAIYLALAAVVIVIGRNYSFGSSARMGPGYFPVVLGSILALLGAVSVIRSFLKPGEPVAAFAWRPLLLILGAVVLFGLLLERAGVIIALAALMTVGAFASRYFTLRSHHSCVVRRADRVLRAGVRQRARRADADPR